MEHKSYSLWDTLPDVRRLRLDALGIGVATAREQRSKERVQIYELAAQGREQNLRALAEDLRHRHRSWEQAADDDTPLVPDPDRKTMEWSDWIFFGFDEGALLILGGVLALGVALIAAVPVLLALTTLHIARARRKARCRRALSHKHCPDCGYDLTGVPDAVEPRDIESLHTGPRTCVECASPWPLLPPPRRRFRPLSPGNFQEHVRQGAVASE